MQDIIGYYDLKGNYLGKKQPPKREDFILVMAVLRKKICENKETSPYQIPINFASRDFCDKKRLMLHAMWFKDGKLKSKINRNRLQTSVIRRNNKTYNDLIKALERIANDVHRNGDRMRYTCGKLKVPINNKYVLF